MRNRLHSGNSMVLGLFLAAIGFSYAVATLEVQDPNGPSITAEIRAVGTSEPLRFTNPFLPAGFDPLYPAGGDQITDPDVFDLGDACYGSIITRYITATGGVRPYSFASTDLDAILTGTGSSLTLTEGGCLMGSVHSSVSSPLRFTVTVTDSKGTDPNTRTGIFWIGLEHCVPGLFRFAMSQLPDGVLGRSYIGKLETLGGLLPITFSSLEGTVTIDGVSQGSSSTLIDSVGLMVFEDGTVAGRPLVTGTITFTARAIDSLGTLAKDRTNTVTDQTITLVIENSEITSTDLASIQCKIKGDTAKPGKDSVKYTGMVNIGSLSSTTLFGGRFDFRVGTATFNQTDPKTGEAVVKIDERTSIKAILGDGTKIRGKINRRNGQLKLNIKKTNIADHVDASELVDGGTKRLVLQVQVGDELIASELIEFAVKVKGTKFQLIYKLGKFGRPLGGAFQIMVVKGKDQNDIAGTPGDKWFLQFIAVPRFGIDATPGLDAVSSLSVNLGDFFGHTITSADLKIGRNGSITYKNKIKLGVKSLKLDNTKYKSKLLTHPISMFQTAIPTAEFSASVGGASLPFGLELDRSGTNSDYMGESARQMTARKKAWEDKVKF